MRLDRSTRYRMTAVCDDCAMGRQVRLEKHMRPESNVAWCWREKTSEGWAWVKSCPTCSGRGWVGYYKSLPPMIPQEAPR